MRKSRWAYAAFMVLISVVLIWTCQQQKGEMQLAAPQRANRLPFLPDAEIHNIIFFIGDGMGIAQITSTRIHMVGPNGRLTMDRFPVVGLVTTHSADDLITDSAAGATAMSTGVKTRNGMLGMGPDTVAYETILERLQKEGKATGLVVTSAITHATPAGFASHVPSRKMQDVIAQQLLDQKVHVLLGGGRKFFIPSTQPGSGRKDTLNLIARARKEGYQVVFTRQELLNAHGNYLLGLFAEDGMTTREPEPSLAEMTRKALEILQKDPDGFFLMVEGSQIDWGGHANDPDMVMRQLWLMDQALKEAVDFALKDRHTLIVVTADHETGGMALMGGTLDGKKVDIDWTTHHHTGESVPLFAFGPHALAFSGVMDNTDIPKTFLNLLHVQGFPTRRQ